MSIPPKTLTVKCPQCQQIYIDWHIPAVNTQQQNGLTSTHQPSTICSQCGHRTQLSELRDRNGVLQKQ